MLAAGLMDSKSECLGEEVLSEYILGKFSGEVLDLIDSHIAECPRCVSLLDNLPVPNDSLEQDLRSYLSPAADEETPEPKREQSNSTIVYPRLFPSPSSSPVEETLPTAVGPYAILGKIGHGGMGVVYRARQQPINRIVALKMILAGQHAGTQALARFQVEGKAAARLQHPGVVQVYDFGEADGLPYFSMELIDGGNLSARLAEGPFAFRQAAELVRSLAEAMAFAHERHVLHRDLKPGNILLTADGQPKIADFGLAKLLDNTDGQTCSDLAIGTASYMAPEQASGQTRDATPAVDIYALGAILFELLAGRPPFKGPSRVATLKQVCEEEPPPPSKFRRGTPPVLEAICLKCLRKAPAQRYPSSRALADDLDCWLRGEPTVARPPRWPARLGRRLYRYRIAIAATLTLAAIIAGVRHARPDPDLPLREIEAQLAEGKPVELIGETGMPRWFRWESGAGKSQVSLLQEDDCFSIHTQNTALLTLLPTIKNGRYRFSAEVRHEVSANNGRVGVFFGHSATPYDVAPVQTLVSFTYNDTRSLADIVPVPPLGTPEMKTRFDRSKNHAELSLNLNSERPRNLKGFATSYTVGEGPAFTPTGSGSYRRQPPRWRKLEVEVSADSVAFSWEKEPLRSLSIKSLTAAYDRYILKGTFDSNPGDGELRKLPKALNLGGALGLYIHTGSAAFRNVNVEALPD